MTDVKKGSISADAENALIELGCEILTHEEGDEADLEELIRQIEWVLGQAYEHLNSGIACNAAQNAMRRIERQPLNDQPMRECTAMTVYNPLFAALAELRMRMPPRRKIVDVLWG